MIFLEVSKNGSCRFYLVRKYASSCWMKDSLSEYLLSSDSESDCFRSSVYRHHQIKRIFKHFLHCIYTHKAHAYVLYWLSLGFQCYSEALIFKVIFKTINGLIFSKIMRMNFDVYNPILVALL